MAAGFQRTILITKGMGLKVYESRERGGETSLVLACCRNLLVIALGGASMLGAPVWAQKQASLVKVDAVKNEPLSQTIPVIGRLVARQAGSVAARTQGAVARFLVEVGDRVAAGQVLAELDTDELLVGRDLAASRLAETQAKFKTKQASVTLARQERVRLERLKGTQASNKARYEDALQAEAVAIAGVGEGRAAIAISQGALRLTDLALAHAKVKAPYAGVVTQRLSEAGAYVQKGQDIVRMVGDEVLEVEADVPAERCAGLTPGVVVRLQLDDGSEHQAKVRAVIPEENPLTRTRAVRFIPDFANTARQYAVQQSVTVHVPLGAARTVLSVHKDAVTKKGKQSFVYVVIEATAKLRPVQLGEAVGNRFEVLGGLEEGEVVVIRGNERLRPDTKVRVAGASS